MVGTRLIRYKSFEIRTVKCEHETCFVAKDICDVLGIVNARCSLKGIKSDGKAKQWVPTIQGMREVWVLNPLGLYQLSCITTKDKKEATEIYQYLTQEEPAVC